MIFLRRGGRYLRVADPDWDDPLDGANSAVRGGRWNPAGSFPVVYLNRDIGTARASARRLLENRLPFLLGLTIDDLDPTELPVLVGTDITEAEFVDVVTDAGCRTVGLPATYPRLPDGSDVEWETCQPIGSTAWDAGAAGVASRSAAPDAPPDGEELAWFQRRERLTVVTRQPFANWYTTAP